MKYIYSDELKHHGVPGQKWGVRRKRAKNNKAHKSHFEIYEDKTKTNTRIRRAGEIALVTSGLLASNAKNIYKKNAGKTVSSLTANSVNASYYGAKALQFLGSSAILGSTLKQGYDYKKHYWKFD